MTALRVVTINTAKGDFAYARRVSWLATSLRALTPSPDVVLLQEALRTHDDRGDAFDTAGVLAEALGLTRVDAPARRKLREVEGITRDTTSGLAILSRYPIVATDVVPLLADAADGERIALLVQLAVGDEARVLLAAAHLTHLRGEAMNAMRRAEVATILAHPWFAESFEARIIAGDLNTRLADLPALLAGHEPFALADGWVVAGGDGPRATMPVTVSRSDPRAVCLDYVLVATRPGETSPTFAEAQLVLDEPSEDGDYPSDHRGVAVTLVLDDDSMEEGAIDG